MIEKAEPIVDAVLGDGVHRDVANLGQSFGVAGESLDRLGVVDGVPSNGLFRIGPSVFFLAMLYERLRDRGNVVSLQQGSTCEAFHLHGFLLRRLETA